jgi:hypothetical protein
VEYIDFSGRHMSIKLRKSEQVGSTMDVLDRMPSQECILALPEMSIYF